MYYIYKKKIFSKYFSSVSFAIAINNRVLSIELFLYAHWVVYSVSRSMRQEVTGNWRIIIMNSFKIPARRKILLGWSNQRQRCRDMWQNMKDETLTEALFGTHDGKRLLGKCRLSLKNKTTMVSKKMEICQFISLRTTGNPVSTYSFPLEVWTSSD